MNLALSDSFVSVGGGTQAVRMDSTDFPEYCSFCHSVLSTQGGGLWAQVAPGAELGLCWWPSMLGYCFLPAV